MRPIKTTMEANDYDRVGDILDELLADHLSLSTFSPMCGLSKYHECDAEEDIEARYFLNLINEARKIMGRCG